MCLSYVLQALLCQKNYLLCTFMVLCCKPHGHCEHFHETQARKGCGYVLSIVLQRHGHVNESQPRNVTGMHVLQNCAV